MRHEEFAERMAGRLEDVAAALDEEERRIGRNPVAARANEMRVAARVLQDASEMVTWEKERRSA